MIRMYLKVTLAALAAGGMMLGAQQTEGFKAGAALPLALDSTRTYTHQSVGLALDGAYQGRTYGDGAFYRAGLGLVALPGKEQEGTKVSFTGIQAYGDLVLPLGKEGRLAVITGLSVNNWSRSVTRADGDGASGGVRHAMGKMGFRAGLEYSVSSRVTLSALLQMTELGTDSALLKDGDPDYGTYKVNPSWIQLGFHYNF